LPELAYVNGKVTPVEEATVGVEDRGFQFADGIYEVVRSYNGKLIDLDRHMARLGRSAAMLDLPLPMPLEELDRVALEFYESSRLPEAMLYLQVTRGAGRRQHAAAPGLTPTLVMTVRAVTRPTPPQFAAITVPNNRWRLCACKTVALLPTVLAKHAAAKAGADEAIFVDDDGTVLEGASDNVFAVKDGVYYTPETDGRILAGITRERVLEQLADRGADVRVGRMTVDFLRAADEAFITSSVLTIVPVVTLDGRAIGDGKVGPAATAVREEYWRFIREVTA